MTLRQLLAQVESQPSQTSYNTQMYWLAMGPAKDL
ncbi:hypothetical protein ED21_21079 [Erythrobacter sp. SD-21]|nr:hypothetical protein ED21_21079 [Erythrobacter sp. SD-21]